MIVHSTTHEAWGKICENLKKTEEEKILQKKLTTEGLEDAESLRLSEIKGARIIDVMQAQKMLERISNTFARQLETDMKIS